MRKKIFLTENEFVSLIKRTILEMNEDKFTIQSDVLTYQGDSEILNKLNQILTRKGELNDEELKSAQIELEKEKNKKLEKPVNQKINVSLVRDNSILKNSIITKGKKTYEEIKNNKEKKLLFKTKTHEFGFPSDTWTQQNIESLKKFKEITPDIYQNKEIEKELNGKKFTRTLGEWVDILINALNNKSEYFTNLLRKDESSSEYTELPKMDTHWINWTIWIENLDNQNKLGDGNQQSKIENFFEKKPIRKVVSENDIRTINHIKQVQSENNIKFSELSFAEYELLKDALNGYKQTSKRINKTTQQGNKHETDFLASLKLFSNPKIYNTKKKIEDKDIISFSSPGNQVDVFFGIDLIVNLIDKDGIEKWVPIQVKSSEDYAKKSVLLRYKIGGISVFKENNLWSYFDGKSSKKQSFENDYLWINE